MEYKVLIEGQEIPVPENIGEDDELLTRALAPAYPGAAKAKLKRVKVDDTHTTIEVIKQAGTKGSSSPLDFLSNHSASMNPAIKLYMTYCDPHLTPVDSTSQREFQHRVHEACTEGETQGRMVEETLRQLNNYLPQPSSIVPLGF